MYWRETRVRKRTRIQVLRMEGVEMMSLRTTGALRKGPNGTKG